MSLLLDSKLNHITGALPEEWLTIPSGMQYSLIEMYNVYQPSIEDLQILADLYHGHTGSVYTFDCADRGAEHIIVHPNNCGAFQGIICFNESNYEQDCCIKASMSDSY